MTDKTPTEIAAAAAQYWRERVADITGQIAATNKALSDAEAERQSLAVAAAGGDVKAVNRLAELRRAKAENEAVLDDLRLALGEADRQSAEAEAVHQRALRADLHVRARELAARRTEAGRKWDEAAAALSAAYAEWADLGRQIASMDLTMFRAAPVSAFENVAGATRLQRAFPLVVQAAFPHAVNIFPGGGSLAESEAAIWRDLRAA